MPKQNERQCFINEIVDVTAVAILEEEDDEDLVMAMDLGDDGGLWSSPTKDLQDLLLVVQGSRFLSERHVVPKSVELAAIVFNRLPDYKFRRMTRMTRSSFHRVLCEIENHPVFHNNSTFSQKPV